MNKWLDTAIWITIILLYMIYNSILLLSELILSYIVKWISYVKRRSIEIFRRSIKSLQMFILEVINSIIHR